MISIVSSMIIISVIKENCYYCHNHSTYCHYPRLYGCVSLACLTGSVLGLLKALLEDFCETLKALCLWRRNVD